MSVIPKGSLILVTGVSGYIASHTVLRLLEAGDNVRGKVRSLEKAQWLYDLFIACYGEGRFKGVEVPDTSVENAFNEAVKGVDWVCHRASVMSSSSDPNEIVPIVVRMSIYLTSHVGEDTDGADLIV